MRRFSSLSLVTLMAVTAQTAASSGPKSLSARPDPNRVVRIAVLQAGTEHSKKGNPGCAANFGLLAGLAREAAKATPDLIVFPEYAISGWPYPSEETINGLAETVPGDGPWYSRYKTLAQETHTALLGWLVEKDRGKLYNCSFLVDPNGRFVGKYRKVQANLGEQTWWGWSQGESFRPIEYRGVKYGISICADMWFPETVRCEELLGADVIVHVSIADDMMHIIPTRAFDSEIPIVLAIFNGGSYAVDSQGKLMNKLSAETPGWQGLRPRSRSGSAWRRNTAGSGSPGWAAGTCGMSRRTRSWSIRIRGRPGQRSSGITTASRRHVSSCASVSKVDILSEPRIRHFAEQGRLV